MQRWLIDVTSTALNRPPLFVGWLSEPSVASPSSFPAPPATQDELFRLTLLAQDPEGQGVRYELASGPAAMTVDPQSGLLTWTPTAADLGWHRVAVRAYDPLEAFGEQTFYVEVRAPNTPPRFTSSPLTAGVAGAVYRHLVTADDDDAFTFSVIEGPPGMTIDAASGLLFWRSSTTDAGQHDVAVRVTDDRGLWSDQPYTLHLAVDSQPPAVSVLLSDELILLETTPTVTVRVSATDNVAVTEVALSLDGTPLPPDAWRGYEFTPPGPGLYHFTATAADAAGNVGAARRTLRVFDPGDTTPPVVEITSPAAGDVITYLTDVVGTVTDENLEYYRLQYALAGSDQWFTFYDSAVWCGTPYPGGGITNDWLGDLDPTLLQRDEYDLRLVAQDINGRASIAQWGLPISVEAQAVLGNFRLDFTDLTIPLAGISIQVHRTYDTLNAGRSGDLGFGWQLSFAEARLRETVRVTEAERSGIASLFAANPFRQGTRVYLKGKGQALLCLVLIPSPTLS